MKIFQTLFAYVCHSLKMLQFRTANFFFTYFLPVDVKIRKKEQGGAKQEKQVKQGENEMKMKLGALIWLHSFFFLLFFLSKVVHKRAQRKGSENEMDLN